MYYWNEGLRNLLDIPLKLEFSISIFVLSIVYDGLLILAKIAI